MPQVPEPSPLQSTGQQNSLRQRDKEENRHERNLLDRVSRRIAKELIAISKRCNHHGGAARRESERMFSPPSHSIAQSRVCRNSQYAPEQDRVEPRICPFINVFP